MQVTCEKYMIATLKHDCKIELNDAELRATPARMAVMKLLETTETPVDVAMIIDYLAEQHIKTDPATAFRIMHMFTEKGITKQISFNEGKFRYELANKADHHHLICTSCGKVEDFSDCAIPDLEKDIKRKKKFLVKAHSLEFFGLCEGCQG
jgi:Fur family ferric uptake transcriptional regulator